MKAQTLAISIPNHGCNKNCNYCISKMTGYVESNFDLMMNNVLKVKKYIELAQINNIIFTSKGEPFYSNDSMNQMYKLMQYFKEYPMEIQTNGLYLKENLLPSNYLKKGFLTCGINTFAISIDDFNDIHTYKEMICNNKEFIWRATVNLCNENVYKNFDKTFEELNKAGFNQISFREITIPHFGIVDTEESLYTSNWIEENIQKDSRIIKEFIENFHHKMIYEGKHIRSLPYGANLYDIKGISCTYFKYCIQDTSKDDDIRSLIFMEDGHLYTSWNSKASIIF